MQLNDKEMAEQCLCNSGVALGNIQVKQMKRNFSMQDIKAKFGAPTEYSESDSD